MLRITARAIVKPTEDEARVRQALLNLFPEAAIAQHDDELVAAAPNAARLRQLIASQRIPDTARGQMLAGLEPDGLTAHFVLGKQAAAAGKAHFGAIREPLGPILVTLAGDAPGEVERAIYKLAPDTTVDPELAEIPIAERPTL